MQASFHGISLLNLVHYSKLDPTWYIWLKRVCERIRAKCKDIKELYFLHILRQLNIIVDRKANEACGKKPGPLTQYHISVLPQYLAHVFYGWLENFRLAEVFIIQGSSYTVMCEPM